MSSKFSNRNGWRRYLETFGRSMRNDAVLSMPIFKFVYKHALYVYVFVCKTKNKTVLFVIKIPEKEQKNHHRYYVCCYVRSLHSGQSNCTGLLHAYHFSLPSFTYITKSSLRSLMHVRTNKRGCFQFIANVCIG